MRTHTPVSTVDKAEPTHDRQFVSALARGLKVMSVFGAEDQVLSNNEISHRTGLPKPTISRLTYTLCKLGYLSQDSAGRYRLDPHVLTLGFPVLARLSVREIARPMMQALAEQYGVTVSLVLPGRPLLALGCGAASAGLPNSKLRELGVQIRDIVRRIEFIHESSLSGLQGGA